jgi:hypothetical protein
MHSSSYSRLDSVTFLPDLMRVPPHHLQIRYLWYIAERDGLRVVDPCHQLQCQHRHLFTSRSEPAQNVNDIAMLPSTRQPAPLVCPGRAVNHEGVC